MALLGDPAPVSFRPEKVRIGPAGAAPADGEVVADGVVTEVVYTGPATRFIVRLDAGAEVQALVQNTGATTAPAVGRGDRVQVGFSRSHVYRVTTKNASATDSVADEGEATIADRVRGTVSQGGNT